MLKFLSRDDVLKCCLVSVFWFNLADTVFTVFYITKGAVEQNPIMAYLLELGPWYFIIVKLVCGTIYTIFMWKVCHNKIAKVGIVITFILYGLLMLYYSIATLLISLRLV